MVDSSLTNLPPQLLKEIGLKVKIPTLIELQFLSKRTNNALSNQVFYKNRIKKDFGEKVSLSGNNKKLWLNKSFFRVVGSRDIEAIKYLLDMGADPNFKYENERTVLMLLAFKNNKELVELLLKYGADPNLKDVDKKSALMFTKNKEIAELLLKNGADPNTQSKYGGTSLMYAAEDGDVEFAKLLLKYMADPYLKDVNYHTAFKIASFYGNNDVMKLLQPYDID